MRFIRTIEGGLVNSRHIVKLENNKSGVSATLVDGSRVGIAEDFRVLKEGLGYDLIPANPGFLLAMCFPEDSGEPGVIRTSEIIAWRVDDYSAPTPVTYDGEGTAYAVATNGGARPQAIVTPLGGVYEWQLERWADNVEEFKQRAIEEAEIKKKEAAE